MFWLKCIVCFSEFSPLFNHESKNKLSYASIESLCSYTNNVGHNARTYSKTIARVISRYLEIISIKKTENTRDEINRNENKRSEGVKEIKDEKKIKIEK